MSCPAVGANGPDCPQPVMRPYTSRGLTAQQSSGPNPRRSVTPGRKPSSSTSALAAIDSTIDTPSGCWRATMMERRLRRSTSLSGGTLLAGGPGRSTRTTSAPMSASSMAAYGPGPIPARSMTLSSGHGPSADRSSVEILDLLGVLDVDHTPFHLRRRCELVAVRQPHRRQHRELLDLFIAIESFIAACDSRRDLLLDFRSGDQLLEWAIAQPQPLSVG